MDYLFLTIRLVRTPSNPLSNFTCNFIVYCISWNYSLLLEMQVLESPPCQVSSWNFLCTRCYIEFD